MMTREKETLSSIPGDDSTLSEPLRVPDALRLAAQDCGLTRVGLVLRALGHLPALLPRLFRGSAPMSVKLNFILAPAVRAVLTARMSPEKADLAFRRVLYAAAAAAPLAAFGQQFPLKDSIPELAGKYRKVFSGPGKHQQVSYGVSRPEEFQFQVLKCSFRSALEDLGLGAYISVICDADRWYWSRALVGTDVLWSKNRDTLGYGGTHCHSLFRSRSADGKREAPVVLPLRQTSDP